MKKKKVFIIILTTILGLSFVVSSAWAGSKQRHIWEGVAIGIGAAIVGSALINHNRYYSHYGPPPVYSFNYSYHSPPPPHRYWHRRPPPQHRYWHRRPRHHYRYGYRYPHYLDRHRRSRPHYPGPHGRSRP